MTAATRTLWCPECDSPIDPDAASVYDDEQGGYHLYEVDEPVLYGPDRAAEYRHELLPPEWQAWAEAEPELSARHKLAVWVLLASAAWLVVLVIGRIVWQGISAVVGL